MDVDMSNSVVFITAKNNSSTRLNGVEQIEAAVATDEQKWNDRNAGDVCRSILLLVPEKITYSLLI